MRESSVTAMLKTAARAMRQVLGAPDYERYLAHVREQHPETTPLTRDAFIRTRLTDRYSKPGARCC